MTGPGLYYSMPAAEYHADCCDEPSLSSSIANILLTSTPKHARAAHPRLNPAAKNVSTKAMDLGSVTHELLLGRGSGFECLPFDDYRSPPARHWRDNVIARGKIPIKSEELDVGFRMASSVRSILVEIPGIARALIDGNAEPVAIWRDKLGPICRTMIDWLDLEGGIIWELKTTRTGIGDRSLNAKIAGEDTAFDMRAAFRQRGLAHLFPSRDFVFRWIFVESSEPFEARVFEADETTRVIGERRCEFAISKWHECLTANSWPGYPRKIETAQYPDWAIADMHL